MAFSNDAHRRVGRLGLQVDLRASAPHHDHPRKVVLLAELLDVVHHLFGKLHLVLAGLHVGPLQSFDVVLAENGFPRHDFFDLRPHGLQKASLQNAGVRRAFEAVVVVDIPAAKDQVIDVCQRNKVLDRGHALVGAFAQTDRSHLSQRADRLRDLFLYRFNACDERGADCAQAGNQYTQLSRRLFDLYTLPNHKTSLDSVTHGMRRRGWSSWRASNPDSCGLSLPV